MCKCIILDTETNDLPHNGGEAYEIAYIKLKQGGLTPCTHSFIRENIIPNLSNFEEGQVYHQFFLPHKEFSPQATAKNGYVRSMLLDKPCISTFVFPEDVEYMIGHNIVFDHAILKKPKVKLICTLELAKKYLTKQSGKGTKGVNTLTGLVERYYPEEAKELIANAHSALQDCKLCYLILLKVLEAAPELDSFEKLATQCKQPSDKSNETKLPSLIYKSEDGQHILKFGKYNGTSVEVVKVIDKSYLTWIVEKSTMNQGLKDFVKELL